MKTTKRVEWSYATSPNADRLGFKTGCWTVELVTDGMPRAIAGFADLDDARANAEKMPVEWDRLTK